MRYRLLLLLLAVAATAGCGPELVGGGEHGDVETVMTDDPGGDASLAPAPEGPSMSRSVEPSQQVLLEGAVSTEVTVELLTAGGAAIPVTDADASATIALGSGDRVTLDNVPVEVGAYPTVRLTFTRAEVELTVPLPGPGAGAGLSLAVDLSAGPAVIVLPVALEVAEDEKTTLSIDLNTGAWVPLADPVTGLVSRQAFAAAVGVGAEGPE